MADTSLIIATKALPDLPIRVPREAAAPLVKKYFFEISPRTLERWPLPWRLLNGKAHCETADLFAEAGRRLAAAPVIAGGKAPSDLPLNAAARRAARATAGNSSSQET